MMATRKIRAFLDTNVLLEYIGGKAELRRLFSTEVRERAAFAINAIVLQELLLARDSAPSEIDLTSVIPYLEVVGAGVDPYSAEVRAGLGALTNYVVHSNDVLILAGARACDVLLTYDIDLLKAGSLVAVPSETPEAFLDKLQPAA